MHKDSFRTLLFDQASAGFLMDEKDEKLLPLGEAFAADMDEPTLARARRFIEEYFELNNSLAMDTFLQELGIA